MVAACIASGIAGLIAGLVNLKAYAFATPCLTAIVQFVAPDGGRNIIFAVIIFAVSFILSFVLAFIMTDKGGNVQAAEGSADGNVQTTGKLQDGQHDNASTAAGNGEKNSAAAGKPLTVYNPLKGIFFRGTGKRLCGKTVGGHGESAFLRNGGNPYGFLSCAGADFR